MEFIILWNPLEALLPILPIILLVFLVMTIRKKKQFEGDRVLGMGYGRSGKKDHLWLLLKDYLKKKSLYGYSIDVAHIFDRPVPEDLHNSLKKAFIFREKQEAKAEGRRYIRPHIPKRFEIEDHFERLESETYELNREFLENRNRRSRIPRKRYVILFRTKLESEGVSDWKALEAEVLRKSTKEGTIKDTVVINRELNVESEMSWIGPLLHSREEERKKKEKAKKKGG